MIELSDKLLMAYVDGQLDKPQSDVVSRLLRDDPDLAIRVSRFQQTQAQLLDTFGALLREGTSAAAKVKKKAQAQSQGMFSRENWLAAGVAATFMITGACIGVAGAQFFGLFSPTLKEAAQLSPTDWPADIADFHSYFTADSMRMSAESQSNPDVVRLQLSQEFSGLTLPDFSEQSLKFMRGQVLSYRGAKVMQLAYVGKKQPLVALYISAGGSEAAPGPGRFGDVNTVSWSDGEQRFLIAANLPNQALQALSIVAKAQLKRK
jgi:anti-sigma factor RsiW